MIAKVRPTQVYHWYVTFEDGFKLDQYSRFGGERIIRNITDLEEAVKGGNFFKRYEAKHGRVVNLKLLPFLVQKIIICKLRNPFMSMVNDPNLKAVNIDIPEDCYVSFFKSNLIDYNVMGKKGKPTGHVSSYTITFHDRSNKTTKNTFDITFKPVVTVRG